MFRITFRDTDSTLDVDFWVKDLPKEKKPEDVPCVYVRLYNTKKEILIPMTISPNPQIIGKYGKARFNPLLQNHFGAYRILLVKNFVERNWETLIRHWFGKFGNNVLIKTLLQMGEKVDI